MAYRATCVSTKRCRTVNGMKTTDRLPQLKLHLIPQWPYIESFQQEEIQESGRDTLQKGTLETIFAP